MDIMQAILDIEQKAQGIVDSADELKAVQETELQKEIEGARNKIDADAHMKIAQITDRAAAERQEAVNALEKEYRSKIEALDNRCRENKQRWIDEITAKIINQ